MKPRLICARWRSSVLLALFALASTSHAQIVFTSPTLNLAIPDGDLVGLSDSHVVPPLSPDIQITDLSVVLNVAGDYNGDLYALLIHDDGNKHSHAVLLNRVGRTSENPSGYSDAGLNIQLND